MYRGGQFLCNRLTQEPITWSVQPPYWAYVTTFSQNGLFLDYLFAGNRLLELAWVMRSMKRKEKKWRPYAGRSSYQNYVNSASLLLYSNIPILPFLIYPTILCKFFTLAKKFAGERIIVLFLSCLHLKSLHPHSP